MREPNDYLLLGLYRDLTPATDGVAALRQLGIANDRISVLSAFPYPLRALGRPRLRDRLALITAIGAAVGFLLGIFIMVGVANLYPLDVGGQPLVPGPPSIVIVYEFTLLSMLAFVFTAFALGIRTPAYWSQAYDPRLTEDSFGILAGVSERQIEEAEDALRLSGAYELRHVDESGLRFRARRFLGRPLSWGLWIGGIVSAVIGIGILLVFAYGIIQWIYPDQMVTMQSVGYQEGPRLTAPTEAVPIQGPVLIDGQPATEPLPGTATSRERGAILFRNHCYMCHGNEGQGNGPLAGYYSPPPANFADAVVQDLPPSEIFRVITLGRGVMPSLAEGLTVGERWDIVSLIKPALVASPTPSP
jgi:mono/diheme cytochrome c family protein